MARLRVGIDPEVISFSSNTGHGRVWNEILGVLHDRVRLQVAWSPRRRPWQVMRPRPDVWLADGHRIPRRVDGPVVSIVHEVGWHDAFLRSFLDEPYAERIEKATAAAVAASTRVVTPSESARQEVLAAYGMSPSRVHSVGYGVDLSLFRPGLEGGDEIVAAARGGPIAPYILYVGAAVPRKNIAALRDAMVTLVARGAPHVLVLVFSGAPDAHSAAVLRDAQRELPDAASRLVVMRGPDDLTLARLMAGADAFCLPSFSEGFGLPVLEAMACGAPVVVSNRGPLPEIVGEAGLLVDPTASGVKAGLERLLSEPALAHQLRRAARSRAEEFPWSRAAEGCLRVLEQAADEPRSASGGGSEAPGDARERATVSCPVCASPATASWSVRLGRQPGLRRCRRCRTLYAARHGAPEDAYVEGYSRGLAPPGFGFDVHNRWWQDYLLGAGVQRVRILDRTAKNRGRLFDVGCGTGELMVAARRAGWEVVGLDPVPDSAEFARRRGFEVWCARLEDVSPPVDGYAAVSAIHVLEHMPEATRFIRTLGRHARPGGHLLIEVPNWRSATRLRYRGNWHYLRPLEHVVHFTPATLRAALKRAGLGVVRVRTRSWMPRYLHAAIYQLPLFRRALTRALLPFCTHEEVDGRSQPVPGTFAWTLLCALSKLFDAGRLGDVIVAIARVPEVSRAETPDAAAGGKDQARVG